VWHFLVKALTQHSLGCVTWAVFSILFSSQHYRANEAYIVICMYARVCMQSLTLIEQVVVKIFEVVKRWVADNVWVGVSTNSALHIVWHLLSTAKILIVQSHLSQLPMKKCHWTKGRAWMMCGVQLVFKSNSVKGSHSTEPSLELGTHLSIYLSKILVAKHVM